MTVLQFIVLSALFRKFTAILKRTNASWNYHSVPNSMKQTFNKVLLMIMEMSADVENFGNFPDIIFCNFEMFKISFTS